MPRCHNCGAKSGWPLATWSNPAAAASTRPAPQAMASTDDVVADDAELPEAGWLTALLGLPAITVPCGFDDKGLPIGFQIAGAAFDEPSVVRTASLVERHAAG